MEKKTSKSINYRFYHWGPLLYYVQIPKDKLNKIRKLCVRDPKLDVRKTLAGHLKEEYKIDSSKFFNLTWEYFISYIQAYKDHLGLSVGNKVDVLEAWVNFMKANEWNPPHTHGRDLSCVLYVQFPKEIQKEHDANVSTSAGAGSIEFLGYPGDKKLYKTTHGFYPREGDFFIFPANLIHYVTPFKVPGVERISISANLVLSNTNKKEEKNDQNKS